MSQAADHRQHQQSEHVVDHRRGENDLAGDGVQQAFGREHLGGDADAGGDHRGADEDRFVRRLAPQEQDSPAHQERNDHAASRPPASRRRRPSSARRTAPPGRRGRAGTSRRGRRARSGIRWAQCNSSTLGPIRMPAMISPTMPGWLMRSNNSAISFAETKTISIAAGFCAGPSAPNARGTGQGAWPPGQAERVARYVSSAPRPMPAAIAGTAARRRDQEISGQHGRAREEAPVSFHFQFTIRQRINVIATRNSAGRLQ